MVKRYEKVEGKKSGLLTSNSLRNVKSHVMNSIYNITLICTREVREGEKANIENAEYRRIRQRRLREEE